MSLPTLIPAALTPRPDFLTYQMQPPRTRSNLVLRHDLNLAVPNVVTQFDTNGIRFQILSIVGVWALTFFFADGTFININSVDPGVVAGMVFDFEFASVAITNAAQVGLADSFLVYKQIL